MPMDFQELSELNIYQNNQNSGYEIYRYGKKLNAYVVSETIKFPGNGYIRHSETELNISILEDGSREYYPPDYIHKSPLKSEIKVQVNNSIVDCLDIS